MASGMEALPGFVRVKRTGQWFRSLVLASHGEPFHSSLTDIVALYEKKPKE
jgi:hypothetical protein